MNPARDAADLLGPAAVLDIQDQGRVAAVAGESVRTCPWRSPDTDQDRARRAMWINGYAAGQTEVRARRSPDDTSQDLVVDATGQVDDHEDPDGARDDAR